MVKIIVGCDKLTHRYYATVGNFSVIRFGATIPEAIGKLVYDEPMIFDIDLQVTSSHGDVPK